MKKLLFMFLALVILFSMCIVFAEEEYSSNADVEYGYDKSYDESQETEEKTSSNYDNIDTSYDSRYDETQNNDNSINLVEDEYYSENTGISVYVNGERIKFDVKPVLINSRTMVPLRAIFEALGATVTWDDVTSTAKGVLDSNVVEITIGANQMYKNGEAKELDSPAAMISSRTLVPVRAIAESFDCIVNWYDATQTVEILSMD